MDTQQLQQQACQQLITALDSYLTLHRQLATQKFNQGRCIPDPAFANEFLSQMRNLAQEYHVPQGLITSLNELLIQHGEAIEAKCYQNLLAQYQPKQDITVAFLGNKGTYSYLATYKYCSEIADHLIEKNCATFHEIISAVENGSAQLALMPIENSSSGCINEVYDLLQDTTAKIVGEITYPIEHAILGLDPNCPLQEIKAIYAHPQPLAQCSIWLEQHLPHVQKIPCSSSSDAMNKVQASQQKTNVAIGCVDAGNIYNLHPLATNIANQKHNITRFIAIAQHAIDVPLEMNNAKTSITFTTANKPGSLLKVLQLFGKYNINMVKLQSRPRSPNAKKNGVWAETFYADIMANINDPTIQDVFVDLKEVTGNVKILGCYLAEPGYDRD